jgi:hypothetical protein
MEHHGNENRDLGTRKRVSAEALANVNNEERNRRTERK